MPPDRLLAQHLQSLQSTTPTNVTRLLSTAAHLLATLTNPLNLSLLTHHLLVSPALWPSDNTSTTLHNPLNFISVFQTAASRITRYEREQRERKEAGLTQPAPPPGEATPGGHLTRDEWIRAVIKGADNRSPTSRHVLAFSGLLIGFCGEERQGLRGRLRSVVENALVRAVNMALDQIQDGAEHEAAHIALALNYSFELLSDLERSRITYDKLLPVLLASAFFSSEGFESAMFVEGINRDLAIYKGKTVWPHHSSSFLRVNKISQKPLVTTMGPLARLIAHTIANLHAPWLVQTAADDLLSFSRTLEEQWRQCNLSRIDAAQEKDRLDVQTYQEVLPLLRRILRNALFAITIILRGTLTRILNDPILASDEGASMSIPRFTQCLLTRPSSTSARRPVPPHAPSPLLYSHPSHYANFIYPAHLRKPSLHRHLNSLSPGGRQIPNLNPPYPALRHHPNSHLPQHRRAFYPRPVPQRHSRSHSSHRSRTS